MILYHGSNVEVKEIDLSRSEVGKDFGVGFYLTASKEQAERMASRSGCRAFAERLSVLFQGMGRLHSGKPRQWNTEADS